MYERNEIHIDNQVDVDGNPAGGSVKVTCPFGTCVQIMWQDGPLGRPPQPANGAFVEDVIEAARQRLEFYQIANGGKFACRENALSITKLEEALHWLEFRRQSREKRKVQGLNLT